MYCWNCRTRLYFPLDTVLSSLEAAGVVGVLSHPERNQGLLKEPQEIARLAELGCLMQVTSSSLTGTFGPTCQQMAEWMFSQDLVHFLATDAHGSKSRRPLMRRAFEHVVQLVDEDTAREVCCRNPAAVAAGQTVEIRRRRPRKARTIGLVALAEGGVNCGRSPLTRPSLSLWRQHSSRRPRLLLYERPKTGRTSGR